MKKSIDRFLSIALELMLVFSMNVSVSALAAKQPEEYHINTDGYYYWKIDGKTLVNSAYSGGYTTVGSITISKADAPQDIKITAKKTYSHQTKGTVKVTRKAIESSVGYSQSYKKTVSINISKKNAKAGKYLAQSCGIYKRYKVKQQRYYKIDGYSTKVGNPIYCYVNVFQYENHQLTKQ